MCFGCSQVAVPGKEDERWRGKDEGALFKRWRRTTTPSENAAPAPAAAQPSDLLKFLAIVSIHYYIMYLVAVKTITHRYTFELNPI